MPGSLELYRGSLVLVGGARGEDREEFQSRPVIISPRCPAELAKRLGCPMLMAQEPALRWLGVGGAERYVLELTGGLRVHDQVTCSTEEASCGASTVFGGRLLCSHPWPEQWLLAPQGEYRLMVAAITKHGVARSGESLLQTLPEDRIETVQHKLDATSRLDLDPHTATLAKAGILVGTGLVNDAILLLDPGNNGAASPLLSIALGDAYLQADLPELAYLSYQVAVASTGEAPGLRGRCELGQGRARVLLGDAAGAICHLHDARRLFAGAGLWLEQAEAMRDLAEAFAELGVDCLAAELRREAERASRPLEQAQSRSPANGRVSEAER